MYILLYKLTLYVYIIVLVTYVMVKGQVTRRMRINP